MSTCPADDDLYAATLLRNLHSCLYTLLMLYCMHSPVTPHLKELTMMMDGESIHDKGWLAGHKIQQQPLEPDNAFSPCACDRSSTPDNRDSSMNHPSSCPESELTIPTYCKPYKRHRGVNGQRRHQPSRRLYYAMVGLGFRLHSSGTQSINLLLLLISFANFTIEAGLNLHLLVYSPSPARSSLGQVRQGSEGPRVHLFTQ